MTSMCGRGHHHMGYRSSRRYTYIDQYVFRQKISNVNVFIIKKIKFAIRNYFSYYHFRKKSAQCINLKAHFCCFRRCIFRRILHFRYTQTTDGFPAVSEQCARMKLKGRVTKNIPINNNMNCDVRYGVA